LLVDRLAIFVVLGVGFLGSLAGDGDEVGAGVVVGAVGADVEIEIAVQAERAELDLGCWPGVAGEDRLGHVVAFGQCFQGFACSGECAALAAQFVQVVGVGLGLGGGELLVEVFAGAGLNSVGSDDVAEDDGFGSSGELGHRGQLVAGDLGECLGVDLAPDVSAFDQRVVDVPKD
jgi:hypothetical protein